MDTSANDCKSECKRSEFVVVANGNEDATELPTAEDNSVFMTTLQSSFPGATGMKYKNPDTGAYRAVAVDATGTKLLPPPDGWNGKTFTVVGAGTGASRGSEVSVKRRKVGVDDRETDSDDEEWIRRKRVANGRDRNDVPPTQHRPVDLIVLGVDYKTTDEDFKKYFEIFGTVSYAEIKRTSDGKSKGFGFVQMSTVEEQDDILATADHVLDGRHCTIRIPHKESPDGVRYGGGRYSTPSKMSNKIFVGRLAEKITEERLREFFDKEAKQIKESASVTEVLIPRPFRSFAFITFTHAKVADELSRLSSFLIDGVSVVVKEATPRGESHDNDMMYNGLGANEAMKKLRRGFGAVPGIQPTFPRKDLYAYGAPYGAPAPSAKRPDGVPQAHGIPHSPPIPYSEAWDRRIPAEVPQAVYLPHQYGAVSVVPPEPAYIYSRDGVSDRTDSKQIARGIDAMNLDQGNPKLLKAAWNAFYATLNNSNNAQAVQK